MKKKWEQIGTRINTSLFRQKNGKQVLGVKKHTLLV